MKNAKNGYAGLMQAAADNWPEDEASITVGTYNERMANAVDMADRAYFSHLLEKDMAHMWNVFSTFPDAEQLTTRYNAEIIKLREGSK